MGRLSVLGDAAAEEERETVSFDPVRNEIPQLANYDWVRRLREPSYSLARRRRAT